MVTHSSSEHEFIDLDDSASESSLPSEFGDRFDRSFDLPPQEHIQRGPTQPIRSHQRAHGMATAARENPVLFLRPQRPKFQWLPNKHQMYFVILMLPICLLLARKPIKRVPVSPSSVADYQHARTIRTVLDIRDSHASHNSNAFLEFYVPDASALGQIHTDTSAALFRLRDLCLLPNQLAKHASSANLWKRRVQRSTLPSNKEIHKMLIDVEALSYPAADVGTDLCASMHEAVLQTSATTYRLSDRILEVILPSDEEEIIGNRLTHVLNHTSRQHATHLLYLSEQASTTNIALEDTLATVHALRRRLKIVSRTVNQEQTLSDSEVLRKAEEDVALLSRLQRYCDEYVAFLQNVMPQAQDADETARKLNTSLRSVPAKFQTPYSIMAASSVASAEVNRIAVGWFDFRKAQMKG